MRNTITTLVFTLAVAFSQAALATNVLDGDFKGETGATSERGSTGTRSDTGEKGATGDTGLQGETTEGGIKSSTGVKGYDGETGDTGERGNTSERGLTEADHNHFVGESTKGNKVLDLRVKGIGYRWVQDLEGGDGSNGQAFWVAISVNKHFIVKTTWERSKIGDPFGSGDDRVKLDFIYHF